MKRLLFIICLFYATACDAKILVNGAWVNGSEVLSWTAPATNADGTPLTNLAGFIVYCGPTSGKYNSAFWFGSATLSAEVDTDFTLPDGTSYCAVTAYNASGGESSLSDEVSFTKAVIPPAAPTGLH